MRRSTPESMSTSFIAGVKTRRKMYFRTEGENGYTALLLHLLS